MKNLLFFVVLGLAACGTDDPAEGTNNTTGTTNNMTVAANNTVNNSSNNTTNNNTVNNLNNTTNNSTAAADMGQDMAMSDMGADSGTADMGVDAAVDLGPGPDGDVCAAAIPIAAGQTIDNQTTVGATDDYDARARDEGCPNNVASGRDRVYVLNTPVAGSFRVTVVPEATFNPALYVRLDCAAAVCVTGTVLNGTGVRESVTFDAGANTDYFVIVDGEVGDSGAYSISVQAM